MMRLDGFGIQGGKLSQMSDARTRGIDVHVETFYVPRLSAPERRRFFFAYRVTIANRSDAPVQLISRHWIITDGAGVVEEVKGPGVVGEQPRLTPGTAYEYASFCPLPTEVGTMEGTYQMVTDAGERFDARIAPFTLAMPHALN